jgi:hypothetical protein
MLCIFVFINHVDATINRMNTPSSPSALEKFFATSNLLKVQGKFINQNLTRIRTWPILENTFRTKLYPYNIHKYRRVVFDNYLNY